MEVLNLTQCSHNRKLSRWYYLSNVLMKYITAVPHTREHTHIAMWVLDHHNSTPLPFGTPDGSSKDSVVSGVMHNII